MRCTLAVAAAILVLTGCGSQRDPQPGSAPSNPPAATVSYTEAQFRSEVKAAGWQDIPPSNNGGYATARQFCEEAKKAGNDEPLQRLRAQLEGNAHHTASQLDAYMAAAKKTCGL